MLRRIHLHPLLLGAGPVLLLWAFNAGEVGPDEVLPVLTVVIAGVVGLGVLAVAALRDLRRGALVASAGVVVVLSHGYLLGDLLPGTLALVGDLVLLGAAATWLVRTSEEAVGWTTIAANVLGAVMVVVAAPGVVSAVSEGSDVTIPPPDVADIVASADREPTRDIFYVIPDRYGRADSLATTYGIDNTQFTDFLTQQGFEVNDRAISNYPRTAHSLASTLNMSYLDDLAAAVPAQTRDSWQPVYDMFDDHRVGKVLTGLGYEYVHVGTWWSPTADATSADQVRNYESGSEFAQVFQGTTAVPDIVDLFGERKPATHRERFRAHAVWQLDELDRLVAEAADTTDAPRFVLMHIAMPHEPYVFDTDGSLVTEDEEEDRTTAENYRRQMEYLNSRLVGAVEQLSSIPEEHAPIVVLQADEGPHPERMVDLGDRRFAWDEATDAELQTKFGILSAYRLPGVDAAALVREDMTSVNTFRLILDTYLGTDLGQLDDRVWIYPDPDDLYTFTDVTERVRAGDP